MKQEILTLRASEVRLSAGADGTRRLSGYAAVFNSPSEDFGGWSERIDPSAFQRTLAEGADVRQLVEHDPARIVGRTKNKTLRLSTDEVGLKFECDLPDTSIARDLIISVERGDLDACSFGFITQSDKYDTDKSTGHVTRTLLDVDLLDTSVVCFPAYPATSVGVRSLPHTMPAEMRSRFEARASNPDACTCICAQCRASACGICSAEQMCDGVTRESKSDDGWRGSAELRLRLAEAEAA